MSAVVPVNAVASLLNIRDRCLEISNSLPILSNSEAWIDSDVGYWILQEKS